MKKIITWRRTRNKKQHRWHTAFSVINTFEKRQTTKPSQGESSINDDLFLLEISSGVNVSLSHLPPLLLTRRLSDDDREYRPLNYQFHWPFINRDDITGHDHALNRRSVLIVWWFIPHFLDKWIERFKWCFKMQTSTLSCQLWQLALKNQCGNLCKWSWLGCVDFSDQTVCLRGFLLGSRPL